MRYLLLLLMLPTIALTVDYLSIPANDIIAGSHQLSADGSKFDKRVIEALTTSTLNTTTSILTSGSTFTGTGEQDEHSQFGISLKTDVDGILYTDFSNDGVNWDSTFPPAGFQVVGGIHEFHTGVKLGRFFRVRFLNDSGSDQTYLRLYTYYGSGFIPANSPLNQAVGIDADALITRPTSINDEIVLGRRSGVQQFAKFGHSPSLTATAGEEIVWGTADTFTVMTTATTFTVTYNSTTDGSGTTGALSLFIQYVDANGLATETTHTLGSTGSDTTSFTGLGINRIAIASSGSADVNTNEIKFASSGAGGTQAVIPALEGVTQQIIFHTDANSTGIGRFLLINTNKISGGGSPRVTIKIYIYNRLIRTRFEVFRVVIDTGVENTVDFTEPVGFRLSPSDVLYMVADTDTNATVVNARVSVLQYKND